MEEASAVPCGCTCGSARFHHVFQFLWFFPACFLVVYLRISFVCGTHSAFFYTLNRFHVVWSVLLVLVRKNFMKLSLRFCLYCLILTRYTFHTLTPSTHTVWSSKLFSWTCFCIPYWFLVARKMNFDRFRRLVQQLYLILRGLIHLWCIVLLIPNSSTRTISSLIFIGRIYFKCLFCENKKEDIP